MQMRAAYTLGGTAYTMHHIAPNLPRAKRANARWTKGLVACAWAERAWWFCIVYTSTAVYSRVYCGCCCCRANQPLSTLRHMCAACTFVKVFEPIALWLESRDLCVYVCKTLAARRLLLLYARPTDPPNTHTHSNTYVRELTLAGFAPMQYNNTRELFSHYMGVCVYADLHANVFYPCVFVCASCVNSVWKKNLLHLRMPPTAEIIVWLDGARAVETMFVFAIKCHFECGSHSQPRKTLIPPLWLINRTSWKESAVLTTRLQRSPTRDSLTHFAQSTTHTKVKRMRSASLTNAILPALCQALIQTPPKDWYMRRANRLVSLASDRCVLSVNDVCRTLF